MSVTITDQGLAEAENVGMPKQPASLGIIEAVLAKWKLRIEGRVELSTMSAAIECLFL
jgi:hypothetical protein